MKEQNNLKELRKRKGISQRALAEMLGMTAAGISAYECGKVRLNRTLVDQLTEILNCSTADLFANTDNNYYKQQGNIPIYDQKPVDVTLFSETNVLGYLSVPFTVNTKQYFALLLRSEIADKIGLPKNSYAICRKQGIVKNGEYAIVQLESNNLGIYRYYRENEETIRLESCSKSKDYPSKTYNLLEESVNVVGKLIGRQVIDEEAA